MTLQKLVENNNGGTAIANQFTLKANGPDDIWGVTGNSNVTNKSVDPGTYTISETGAPLSKYNASISCVKNGGAPVAGASITLAKGDVATCTITNDDKPATLTVNKTIVGGTKTASAFSFKVNGNSAVPFESDGSNSVSANAGAYTVTEVADPDYTTAYSNGCSGTLVNGGSATCTITNTYAPANGTLTVKKVVSGSDADESAFSFQVNGGATTAFNTNGQNDLSLAPGTYSVVETAAPGYNTTYSGCSNVQVASNQTATCTVTNTLIPLVADLNVEKTVSDVEPAAGASIFYTITVKNEGPNDATNVVVTDVIPAGLTFVNSTPVHSGTAPNLSWNLGSIANGASKSITVNVTVDNGTEEDTITNTASADGSENDNDSTDDSDFVSLVVDDAPVIDDTTITIKKETNPNGDQTDFSFKDGDSAFGTAIADGESTGAIVVTPGTHTITEVVPTGWTLSDVTCTSDMQLSDDEVTNGVALTLVDGEDVECTFTNTKDDTPAPVCRIGKNLLANASFEDPVVSANGGQWEIFSLVSNWGISSDGLEIWRNFMGGAPDGVQNAELDGNQSTTITQSVTTIPGALYELSFDFSPRIDRDATDNNVSARAGGVQVASASASGVGNVANVWTGHSGTFTATTTSTDISFADLGVSNSYGTLIDNAVLCLVREPVPQACTVTIVSDQTNTVTEKGNAAAKLVTFIHAAWTASISGASWIWGDDPVADPVGETTQTFVKTFNWNGSVTSVALKIAADNSYEVRLNGTLIGSSVEESNHALATQDEYTSFSGTVQNGVNTLEVKVKNWALAGGTTTSNPAGLLYKLEVTGMSTDCAENPTKGTLTLLKEVEDGTATDGDFTLSANGPTSISGKEGQAAVTNALVTPGDYTIGEVGTVEGRITVADQVYEASYSCSVNGGIADDENEVSIDAGDTAICTVTNTKVPECRDGLDNDDDGETDYGEGGDTGCLNGDDLSERAGGSITIDKVVTGNGADTEQDFNFDFDWEDQDVDESISADDEPVVIEGLEAGQYTIEEVNLPQGWTLEDVSCSDENDGRLEKTFVDESNNDNAHRVNLSTDENVSCVFTNKYSREGSGGNNENIIVKKEITSGSFGLGALFNFDVSWDDADVVLSAGGQSDSGDLDINQNNVFTIDEIDLPAGWNLSGVSCDTEFSNDEGESDVEVTLNNGETITCTFTNDQELYTIEGIVWNDANSNGERDTTGGEEPVPTEETQSGWTVRITNGSISLSTTTDAEGNYYFNVPAGTWTVTEDIQGGWSQTFPNDGSYEVTVPQIVNNTLVDSLFALIIPTAHAAVIGSALGSYDFGNVEAPQGCTSNCGGGGGSGKRISLGGGSSNDNDDEPEGEVLGAVAPVGAPNTGMGGTASDDASGFAVIASFFGAILGLLGIRRAA